MVAAENGHSEVAALLCDRGASLDAKRDVDDSDVSRLYMQEVSKCGYLLVT